MEITINRRELQSALQMAKRGSFPRSKWPILQHILCSATDDGNVTFKGTDLEHSITKTVQAVVIQPGECTMPAALATEMVSNLDGETVTIASHASNDEHKVTLSTDESTCDVWGYNPSEFPSLKESVVTAEWKIAGKELRLILNRLLSTIGDDETRKILTGMLFQQKDNVLSIASTDTHRLGVHEIQNQWDFNWEAIVPGLILKLIKNYIPDDEVIFQFCETRIVKITWPGVQICSNLIEGSYPNYRKAINLPAEENCKCVVTIPAEAFVKRLRRAGIVARNKGNKVLLTVQNGIMEIKAESSDVGTVTEKLDVIQNGNNFQQAFNYKYLMDFLKVAGTELVTLITNIPAESTPAYFRPNDDSGYLFECMPMQIM